MVSAMAQGDAQGFAVLAVGAHAADAEFSSGLVLARYALEGHAVTILHLTLGEKGHRQLGPEAYAAQKRGEAERAAALLGGRARFLDYPDAELPDDEAVRWAVADVIREVRPRVVLTHWRGSFHRDHRRTHDIVVDARFLAGLRTLPRARPAWYAPQLLFAENWEDMDGYRADVYVDVSASFDIWQEACAAYEIFREPQAGGFRYRDYYTALATVRGCLGRFRYGATLMRPDADLVTRQGALPG
jgi:LmbE family N-acetylglucosaminyl deacetylase